MQQGNEGDRRFWPAWLQQMEAERRPTVELSKRPRTMALMKREIPRTGKAIMLVARPQRRRPEATTLGLEEKARGYNA